MANIRLLALDQIAWIQVAEDPAVFAIEQRLMLGVEPDLLRSVGQQTVALLQRTSATPPWTGYLAVNCNREIIIGTCSFTAPPDAEGIVEIAYFTFPPFEGRGYATAMAAALVELAEGAKRLDTSAAETWLRPDWRGGRSGRWTSLALGAPLRALTYFALPLKPCATIWTAYT